MGLHRQYQLNNTLVNHTPMIHIDLQSISASAVSFFFLSIGFVTLETTALVVGILVGVSTIAVNVLKSRNEIKRSREIDRGIRELEKQDNLD